MTSNNNQADPGRVNAIGTIYENQQRVAIVHMGGRGARGLPGEQGEQGEQGVSINPRGDWAGGIIYRPNDAVSAEASGLRGVTSLFIQRASAAESVSTTEPRDDPGRWMEIGVTSTEGSFGGTWLVDQPGHPFSRPGQPAAFTSSGYVLANAALPATFGIALVREVLDQNRFILQSTGAIPMVDPSVTLTGALTPGALYYVAPLTGRLTETPPSGPLQFVNAIMVAGPGNTGVVLPWTPAQNRIDILEVPSAREKFFYTAAAGQQSFTGPDNNGQTPTFAQRVVDVFLAGLNLVEDVDYTIVSNRIELTNGANAGDILEVWVTTPLVVGADARVKIDPFTFDGMSRDYPLNVGGVTVPLASAEHFDVFVDGNHQEPFVDFEVLDVGGQTTIRYMLAPPSDAQGWIVAD